MNEILELAKLIGSTFTRNNVDIQDEFTFTRVDSESHYALTRVKTLTASRIKLTNGILVTWQTSKVPKLGYLENAVIYLEMAYIYGASPKFELQWSAGLRRFSARIDVPIAPQVF